MTSAARAADARRRPASGAVETVGRGERPDAAIELRRRRLLGDRGSRSGRRRASRTNAKAGGRVLVRARRRRAGAGRRGRLRPRARSRRRPRGSRRPRPAGRPCRWPARARPRGVAVPGARGVELFERLQPRVEPGELVLARAHRPRAPFVLDARAGQLRLARRAGDARRLDRLVRARAAPRPRLARSAPTRSDSIAHVVALDVELASVSRHAVARGRRVLERVAQRGRRVDRGEHFAARRLDVGFEPFDLAVRGVVGSRLGRAAPPARLLALGVARRPPPRGARRAPARAGSRRASSASSSGRDVAAARAERLAPARGRTRSAAAAG